MAIRCLRLAGIYLLVGMTMGIAMGATERFALAPAHAHVNLLGWVTLAVAAVVFALWPQASTTRLAQTFFWLYNLALPPTMIGLSFVLLGHAQWMPVVVVGQLALYAAAIIFVANLFLHVRTAPALPAQIPVAPSRRSQVAAAEAR